MLIEITKCDSYFAEQFVNPEKVAHVFTVTETNGLFDGKINRFPYTVIVLCTGDHIRTQMPQQDVVAKLNGLVA